MNTEPYFQKYIDLVAHINLTDDFEGETDAQFSQLHRVDTSKGDFLYAPGKWTVKQVVQHLTDSERVFQFRALTFAREEGAVLHGYDENQYAEKAQVNHLEWAEVLHEFKAVRRSTLVLFRNFTAKDLSGHGVASGLPVTVEQLGYIILGHAQHHLTVLEERYGVLGSTKC